MMTHDEVLAAAAADPNGFGWMFSPTSLVPYVELTDGLRESLPPVWDLVLDGDVDDFYNSLRALWYQGCEAGMFAAEVFDRGLQYAAFNVFDGSIEGITYVFSSPNNSSRVFHVSGSLPTLKQDIQNYPDYGPLTKFCRQLHNSFESVSGSFVRHPSWRVATPELDLVQTMPTWDKFFADEVEDREEPIEFTVCDADLDDYEYVPPTSDGTVQYGHTNSYNFVEPGDPVNFWSFWNGDGEMQMVTSAPRDKTINALDDDLSYILRA